MKLVARYLEKPWGRTSLPPCFNRGDGRRIGEIWFAEPGGAPLPLLVKYIFTSERLSVQVHPDDAQAQAQGHAHGKSECWYIVDAEPGASIGIGLKAPMDPASLRAAALDGSIEACLDWKPVRRGDFLHVPAGTIHAIGPGISLIEIQQNIDLTYRLYDYGRPRALHLEDAVAVAEPRPYDLRPQRSIEGTGMEVLLRGPHFSVAYVAGPLEAAEPLSENERWVIPVEGEVRSGGDRAVTGDCLFVPARDPIHLSADGAMLVAAAGKVH